MIASRSGATRLPRVRWRRTATCSLNSLMAFIEANPFGDSNARRKQIEEAVESLRHSPLRCPIVSVKGRLTFRKLKVGGRFVVYDMGSSNGTHVNGTKVSQQVLNNGDLVQVGSTKFRFEQ